MFIKSVTIEGFKSYKNRATAGPFHDGFNIVLGRNGSGKSNFFAAVEFVLSDEYSHLKADQRSSLLSSSAGGARPINAFVEITFDNQDRRFPLSQDEFALRRTIGAKKDTFHLGGKPVTRKQLNGMLEAAGFSHSNPYHIVKQGVIADLATRSDQARLKIVHDLAGTKAYTEKRRQSEEELERSDKTIESIEESLRLIAGRQSILEDEKDDFLKFQKLDASRRTLEYLILDRDLEESRSKAAAADQEYQESQMEYSKAKKEMRQMTETLEELKNDMNEKKNLVRTLAEDIKSQRDDQERKLRVKTGLELRLADLEKEASSQSNLASSLDSESLDELMKNKNDLEAKLKNAIGLTEKKRISLEILEHEMKVLLEKSNRNQSFASISERDTWIKSRISTLRGEIEQGLIVVRSKEDDYRANETSLEDVESQIQHMEDEMKVLTSSFEKIVEGLKSHTKKHTEDSQGIASKSEFLLKLQIMREKLYEQFERELSFVRSKKSMKEILTGNDSIEELLANEPHLREGYHGILLDMFSAPEENLITVLDQTAGIKAFYHVVDSGRTATKLIKELNRRKMPGVFNFIPCDKVRPQSYVGQVDPNLGFPLMEKLEFEPDNEAVLRSVFGKTLVCRNMDAVVQLAFLHKANCITLDGEKGSSNGVLSGGYLDPRRLNLVLYKNMQEASEKVNNCYESVENVENELAVLRASLAETRSQLEKYKIQKEKSVRTIEMERNHLKSMKLERDRLFSKSIELKKSLESASTNVKLLESSRTSLEIELEEEFNSQLDEDERQEFSDKVRMVQTERASFKNLVKAQEKIEADLIAKTSEVEVAQKNLEAKYEKDLKATDQDLKKQEITSELKLVASQLSQSSDILEENLRRDLDERDQLTTIKTKLDSTEQKHASLSELINSGTDQQDQILKRKAQYLEVVKITTEKLKNVEAVDSIVAGKYKDKPRKALSKLFKKVQKDLKEFENINKKALEQFEAFSVKEELDERLEQLQRDREKIVALIEDLDEKKGEQVSYSFKQMKKNFSSIFKKIVPGGKGELVLIFPENVSEEEDDAIMIAEATGLEIEISFTGSGVMKNMSQLSGGQKSVVALTFILALQRCDPAPFYLFDEVDAALDPDYRGSVAAIIQESATGSAGDQDSAQFIVTTFRSEMIDKAEKFFGVFFRGGSSHIKEIEQEQASDFVSDGAIQG